MVKHGGAHGECAFRPAVRHVENKGLARPTGQLMRQGG